VPGVRNATRIYDVLLSMGAPDEHVQVIINRCKAEHERVTPEDVEKHFARPVFATIPNDYRRVMSALDFGHPIFTNSPTSAARLAIYEIARRIVSDPKAGTDQPRRRPGLIGRLLSRK
jgi:pilus assembly protein CpaE